jgi:hypothetical protein
MHGCQRFGSCSKSKLDRHNNICLGKLCFSLVFRTCPLTLWSILKVQMGKVSCTFWTLEPSCNMQITSITLRSFSVFSHLWQILDPGRNCCNSFLRANRSQGNLLNSLKSELGTWINSDCHKSHQNKLSLSLTTLELALPSPSPPFSWIRP